MEVSNLLEKMFKLPFVFAVPDILYTEELCDFDNDLTEFGLKILPLTSETMEYRQKINYPGASSNDLFALSLARQENCPLVTGDGILREACIKEKVVIYGTLWIVDELISHDIISEDEARQSFEIMKEQKRRLPWDIIFKKYK
jgi:predicted nucleic acid-binding protein